MEKFKLPRKKKKWFKRESKYVRSVSISPFATEKDIPSICMSLYWMLRGIKFNQGITEYSS